MTAPNELQPMTLLLRRLETAQCACMDDGQTAAAILLQDARAAIIAFLSPARVTGAADIVDEAACLIWSELCPDTIMSDEDRTHYEAAAKAVLALSASRNEALEAALREAERFVAYLANETDGHFVGSGTPATCLVMIRAALNQQKSE